MYAVRWEKAGRSGYMPAYKIDWTDYNRHKSQGGNFRNYKNKDYLPYDDSAIESHLAGRETCGIYPLLEDNSSFFVAVDFDDLDRQKTLPLSCVWWLSFLVYLAFHCICDERPNVLPNRYIQGQPKPELPQKKNNYHRFFASASEHENDNDEFHCYYLVVFVATLEREWKVSSLNLGDYCCYHCYLHCVDNRQVDHYQHHYHCCYSNY